jgi:hypothetical protein
MSLQCPPLRKILPATLLSCLALLPLCAPAQTSDGQRAKDKPGLALVKSQPWSNEDQSTVLEFLGYTDHSGYYEFRTAKIPNYQVATAKLVKLVVYPEPVQFLATAEQRVALQKTLDDFASLSSKFPAAARQLEKAAATLKADAAKYDSGNVKDGGQWLLRSAYYKQKAAILANLLRPELEAAPKIKDIDLTTNQYYLGLQDLAKAEPSVGPVLDSVRSIHQSLVRKADRAVLLNQLNSPTLGYDAAVDLVKQLKSLQPGEDARSNLFVQSWDTAVANAGQLTKLITDAQAQFERSMPAPDDSGKLPAISPDLASNIDSLSDAVKAFRAGSPPSAIRVPLQLADAMISCGEKIPALAKQIQAREILDAKSELDPLSSQAGVIGPKVSKILAAVQKKLAADIEKFQALRNEAKMLAENDKIEEALKKYQEAYAIIPAKDVAAQIDSLKKQ